MSKFNFANISQNQIDTSKYSVYEKKTNHYIQWGERNIYPDYLIDLYHNSSTHATCVNSIVEAIIGEGLISNYDFALDKANLEGESWNNILMKVAKDFYMFGGYALEIIWSKDRTKIAEVYHIDFSYLRAKEKNYRGQIPGYYIYNEWAKTAYKRNLEDIPYLPCFSEKTNVEEPNQIYVYQPYTPGCNYYPIPTYQGGLKVIDLESDIDTFHLANINNGLSPSLAITTFTNSTEDERQQIERMLQQQYSGTDKAGRMLYMDVASKEEKPEIETIQTNANDSYYEVLNESTTQKILTAHRITSPEIFGIMTPGIRIGNQDAVTEAYLLFLNTVIKPLQQSILNGFDYILEYNYPDIELGIIQLNLFDNNIEEEDTVTTGIDAEVGDDDKLEKKIEEADVENNNNITND